MASRTESDISQKKDAGKLCMAAIVSLAGSFVLFVLCMICQVKENSVTEIAFVLFLFIFVLLICVIAPFSGILAVVGIFVNWRAFTSPQLALQEKSVVCKTARRFLIVSLLYGAACLIPVFFVIFSGKKLHTVMPTNMLSVWFILMALLSFFTGCISYVLFSRSSGRLAHRIIAVLAVIVGLTLVGSIPWTTNLGRYLLNHFEYAELTETFSGNSDELMQTEIVPTLDSPCPGNRNVIWCSSFQLAWNRMKDDVIGAPVEVVGAEELAARLNTAKQSDDDLEASSFYAAAGRIKEGIIKKVKEDMEVKFPKHPVPDFNDVANVPEGILSYSYLTANVQFEYPYRQYEGQFTFTDSQGTETGIEAFGVWGFHSVYRKMREQVEVLYIHQDSNEPDYDRQMKEFVIDLCRQSSPYQVVVAVVEPKDTLAQTLNYIRGQIEDFKKRKNYGRACFLDDLDVLIVPEMLWEIDHRFDELIGKTLANANPAMPIIEAKQSIMFKLDRFGAALESEATITAAAMPRYFRFNRPFMVYMKKRDREQPFFVMWVDNAELLNKK